MTTTNPAQRSNHETNGYNDSPADDVFGCYLREAAHEPLLSPDEEARLGHAIRAWRDVPNPSEDVIQAGKLALHKLVCANLRLVVSIANRYSFLDNISDIVQEGNAGLILAAQRFDPSMGCRFSTYAVYSIRQAILRALPATNLKVPAHIKEQLIRLARLRSQHYTTHGCDAPEAYLASKMRIPVEDVQTLLRIQSLTMVSLSRSLPDSDRCLEDLIADDTAPGSPEDIERREIAIDVRTLLAALPPREQTIVRRYFGIDGERETLASIARSCGISRERVRQIIAESLQRMRAILSDAADAKAHAISEERLSDVVCAG